MDYNCVHNTNIFYFAFYYGVYSQISQMYLATKHV